MKTHEFLQLQTQLNLLNGILAAAKSGHPIHIQLGMSQETFEYLSRLNSSEMVSVASHPFLDLKINDRTLNMSIQRITKGRDREELMRSAMRYGASRDIMQAYANLSHNDFNRLRLELGLNANRRRPSKIQDDEYGLLGNLHSTYGAEHVINDKLAHLRCLVFLAEKSGIDINRIYHYYYLDNSMLFARPQPSEI